MTDTKVSKKALKKKNISTKAEKTEAMRKQMQQDRSNVVNVENRFGRVVSVTKAKAKLMIKQGEGEIL